MIIGIDASRMAVNEKTGVEIYSCEIIPRLCEHANEQKKHKLILFSPSRISEIEETEHVSQKIISFPKLWTQIRLSAELALHKVDVLFVPSHVLPIYHPKNSVITIHDTAFRHFREAYSITQYHYLNWSTRFACRHASKIITPSHATALDLKNLYHCPESKISVIPHGLGEKSADDTPEWKILEFFQQFGLRVADPFIFFVGRLETKKNLSRLVSAFAKMTKYFPDWKLILAGKRGVGFSEIRKKIDEEKLWDRIIAPGYINEAEKKWLYEHCKFFVFPSLFEGFGLPILEAFLASASVLASNSSSIPEVCGNACEYVNPLNTSDIADGLIKLARSPALCENLKIKSKQQLRKFSWKLSAGETWKALTDKILL